MSFNLKSPWLYARRMLRWYRCPNCFHLINPVYAHICVYVPSVLWCCWLGSGKGIACKKLSGGVLVWLSVSSEVQTCIWPSWCQCHSLSYFSKMQIGFTFLVPADQGSHGQRAVRHIDADIRRVNTYIGNLQLSWVIDKLPLEWIVDSKQFLVADSPLRLFPW